MRTVLFIVLTAVALITSFGGGYYYRATHAPGPAEIEGYALSNILEDVAYVHYLAKGDYANMRSLLDVGLNGHLSRARMHRSVGGDEAFEAARVRTLNAVAVIWDQQPPFKAPEWRQTEANASWWAKWVDDHKNNLELLNQAKARCAAMPALNCKAQAPLIKPSGETK